MVTVGVTVVGILSGLAPSASAEPAATPLVVDVVGDSSTLDGAAADPTLQALSRVADENQDLALDVSVAAAPDARTADYFGAQLSADGQTVVNPAQHDQLRPDAQVVLVRFGGNDAELAQVLGLVKQANSTESEDLDVKMRSIEGLLDLSASDEDYLTQALETAPTMVSRMLRVLAGITERAPDSRIVVANYPVAVDAQHPESLAQADPRGLVTAQKVNFDLNESIARAVRICQCADLVDVSDAVAGHEVYTDDSAFDESNPAQPNDRGAALMASTLAADLAGVLGVRAPEATATMIAEPSNVETRVGMSDVDGDRVPDTEDAAPTVPNSDAPAPEPAPQDPGAVDQGLPPSTKPGRDNPEAVTDPDDDAGDQDAEVATVFASTFSSAAAAAPSSARAPKGRSAQPPPLPTRNPDKGDDLGEVPMPDFSLPSVFGDEESRAIALAQLGFTDWTQQQVAPNDNNSVSVDTIAGASRKSGLSGRQFQTTKATRNAQDGTVELEVSVRTGFDQDLVVGKYARGLIDRTMYKLGPESTKEYDQTGKLPNWGTMRPGDSITRTPQNTRAVASEWGLGRAFGKFAKGQLVSYSEGPMTQYTVTALGDGNYSVAFGDTVSNTKRTTFSAKGLVGFTTADAGTEVTRTEVMYSARTPAKMAEMTQALAGLETGVAPTLQPGTFYNSITESKTEATGTVYGSKGGKQGTTTPKKGVDPTSFITADAEVGVTGNRDGVTTTKTTLMKSVDGTLQNSEPVGQYTVVTTRLNTGTPFGPSSYLQNSTPLSTQVRSFYDGPLHDNTITFSMNGQKHTLAEGDMVERARDLAVSHPELVQNNQILTDLTNGVGIVPALSLVNSNDTDAALRALVTPPTPDRNPFATPPMPEQNMWSVPDRNPFIPPMPEQRPADVPPMPERRADALESEDGFQDMASADMLSSEAAFDSLDSESTSDSTSDPAMGDYSVPGTSEGSSPDGVPGTASDLGDSVSSDGYSVPGTSEGSSTDGVPGTASDLGDSVSSDGYSVPGTSEGSSPDGVPGTASDVGESVSSDGYSVPGTSEGSSTDGVPGTASDVGESISSDGYSVPGTSEGSSTDGVPGTASDVGDSTSYGGDSTSFGGDTSSSGSDTSSYGGDSTSFGGDTSSFGGDSASDGGGSSFTSSGGDSTSTSFGGGDSTSSSFGGGDSSSSGFGGDSSSSFGGGSTSSGDSGGSVGGGDGGGW